MRGEPHSHAGPAAVSTLASGPDSADDAPSMQLITERGELLALARITPEATVRLLRVFTYDLTVAVPSANLSRSHNP